MESFPDNLQYGHRAKVLCVHLTSLLILIHIYPWFNKLTIATEVNTPQKNYR